MPLAFYTPEKKLAKRFLCACLLPFGQEQLSYECSKHQIETNGGRMENPNVLSTF